MNVFGNPDPYEDNNAGCLACRFRSPPSFRRSHTANRYRSRTSASSGMTPSSTECHVPSPLRQPDGGGCSLQRRTSTIAHLGCQRQADRSKPTLVQSYMADTRLEGYLLRDPCGLIAPTSTRALLRGASSEMIEMRSAAMPNRSAISVVRAPGLGA
jgi:hypothetical protein